MAPTDHSFGAGPSLGRAQLRPGLLLKMFLEADARPPIKMALFMFGRVEKKSPNPVDKHVGRRVRMRRMMLAMSQEKLGNALRLTFQQVQKYENGTNRIGASRLQQSPISFRCQ